MNHLVSLPPHIWARVLRGATMRDLCVVAHVCRALHVLVTSHDRCLCTSDGGPFVAPGEKEHARTRAFWAHLRGWRVVPSQCEWNACIQLGFVVRVALALRCGVESVVDPSDAWELKCASDRGHAAVVESLLCHGFDPSVKDQGAIRMASDSGHVRIVERLLRDQRVDPSAAGQYALRAACAYGHVDVVDRLLGDVRVDPRHDFGATLGAASARGHWAVVDRLLRDGRLDPSAFDQHALRTASAHGHFLVVALLLEDARVARDVETLRQCRKTALMWKHHDVVLLLDRHVAAQRARAL